MPEYSFDILLHSLLWLLELHNNLKCDYTVDIDYIFNLLSISFNLFNTIILSGPTSVQIKRIFKKIGNILPIYSLLYLSTEGCFLNSSLELLESHGLELLESRGLELLESHGLDYGTAFLIQ